MQFNSNYWVCYKCGALKPKFVLSPTFEDTGICTECGKEGGILTVEALIDIANEFFFHGTVEQDEYLEEALEIIKKEEEQNDKA